MSRLLCAFVLAFLPFTALADAPVPKPKPAVERCLSPERIHEIFASLESVFEPVPLPRETGLAYLDIYNALPPAGHAPADSVLIFEALQNARIGPLTIKAGGSLIVRFIGGCAQPPMTAGPVYHDQIMEALGEAA